MFNKSFLEDEVRLGFYIPSTIKQAWAAQLEVLKVIDNICNKCDIEYYADWGTFLGAVRHHGFIPWDDDLDIVMRREDYEKFYVNAPRLFPDGYSIHTFRNEENFREFHAVVVNANSYSFSKERFNSFHGFSYLCGVDIFILDYLYNDELKESKRDKDALFLIAIANSILDQNLSIDDFKTNIHRLKEITGFDFCDSKQISSNNKTIYYSFESIESKKDLFIKLYELADKKCAEVSREESNTLIQMVPWGLKKQANHRYAKVEYDKYIRLPFEYLSIPVPLRYDRLLTQRYGNYMSIHKAGGAHDYPFFEKQISDFEALLGFSLPKNTLNTRTPQAISFYSVYNSDSAHENMNGDTWKSLLNEGYEHLTALNSIIIDYFSSDLPSENNLQQLFDSICDAQELAINMGNLIESIKGDNSTLISPINDYCEALYHLYDNLARTVDNTSCSTIREALSSSFNTVSNSLDSLLLRKQVVFLPFKASAWDSFKELFDLYENDGNTDVYVIPIPYYYKEFDGTLSEIQYNLDSYPDYLSVIPFNSISLDFLRPDIIFIQNPYDELNATTSIHPDFYSSKLKSYTNNLIYTPWFKSCQIDADDSRAYKNMDYYVTIPGVVNSNLVLLATEQEKKMYIKKLTEWNPAYEKDWNSKISLLSDYLNLSTRTNSPQLETKYQKSILYYIGTGQVFQNEKLFLKKINYNFKLFEKNSKNIKVYLVEDSSLRATLEKYNPHLKNKYINALDEFESIIHGRICSDEALSVDYYNLDAYYGDASFLAIIYSYDGKPVLIQNYDVT